MRWQGRRRSENIEDRRGARGRGVAVGGGLGGIGILLFLIYVLLGGDPVELAQRAPVEDYSAAVAGEALSDKERAMGEFVSVVLADIEDVWRAEFAKLGSAYREPKLVLFSGRVQSACGLAGAATGPFYCPGDAKAYIDLSFFEAMQQQLGAPGDFALAYVLAHEVGHHVQNLLGINERVMSQRARMSERDFNRLMVRMELQADFFAGVWAHHARRAQGFLEEGDIEEGLNAASAVGDDRIMKQARGYVVPDAFTHGTSEQRVRWFRKGLETGDVRRGDTFSASEL